jgi:hypothetical protein
MWNHKPLGEDRDSFIFHVEDFVSAANQSVKGGRLADFIEAYLHRWPNSRIKASPSTEITVAQQSSNLLGPINADYVP